MQKVWVDASFRSAAGCLLVSSRFSLPFRRLP